MWGFLTTKMKQAAHVSLQGGGSQGGKSHEFQRQIMELKKKIVPCVPGQVYVPCAGGHVLVP